MSTQPTRIPPRERLRSVREAPVNQQYAARFLNLHPKTVLRKAREGLLPAHPVGTGRKRWHFYLSELDQWLRSQVISGSHPDRKSTRLNSSHFRISHVPTQPIRDALPFCSRASRWDRSEALAFLSLGARPVASFSGNLRQPPRSEEHTSELQSLPHISCADPTHTGRSSILFPRIPLGQVGSAGISISRS